MTDSKFLPDGRCRACVGAAEEIEKTRQRITATVDAKYQERLAGAGPIKRFWLRTMMAREIQAQLDAEIEKIAPRYGLYLHSLPKENRGGGRQESPLCSEGTCTATRSPAGGCGPSGDR